MGVIGLRHGRPNRSFPALRLKSQWLQKIFEGVILRLPYKRNIFRNKMTEEHLELRIEEPSVMKPVHAGYLLGIYDYMLNFIDMIRIDEDTEIELQLEDALYLQYMHVAKNMR